MVDSDLVNEVKEKLNSPESATPEDVFKLFEVYKEVSANDEGLKAEFEDMDMLGMAFVGEIFIPETDKKIWLSFKDGKVDYGNGDADNPTLKFATGIMTITGILFGTILISTAHEEGNVTYNGAPEELMDFQAITSIINEYLQNN